MGYLDGDRWLDGPALCEWLDAKIAGRFMNPNLSRRMSEWRKGRSRADLYLVDAALVELGLHPMDIPEGCWAADQSHHAGRAGGAGLNKKAER